MASWQLVPCLKTLFAEFDEIAPSRDHASDGSIGDAAHQAEPTSDHNPDKNGNVHAIDVDNDLHQSLSWKSYTGMEAVVQYILSECRKPGTSGKDRGRLKYIIYNRRIWSASSGWVEKPYHGSSAHTEHAHFSGEYDSKYANDTSPWGLLETFGDDMALTDDDLNKIAAKVWGYQITDYADTDNPKRKLSAGTWEGYSDDRRNDIIAAVNAGIAKVLDAMGKLDVNEAAIASSVISGVLAGLAGAEGAAKTIADAVVQALPADLAQEVVAEMGRLLSSDAQNG